MSSPKTARLVVRLPPAIRDGLDIGPRNQRDFSPLREVLDDWADTGTPLEIEASPPKQVQVCFHVNAKTAAALRKEAQRLTRKTGEPWTVSMVITRLWNRSKAS